MSAEDTVARGPTVSDTAFKPHIARVHRVAISHALQQHYTDSKTILSFSKYVSNFLLYFLD
jgi:hypothetical protein